MSHPSNTRLHDPWLTASLLFFSGGAVASVFFRDSLQHSGLLLGLSVFGLLLAWVYSTLPEGQEQSNARATARAAEDAAGSDAADAAPDKPKKGSRIRSAFQILAILSFVVMCVSCILYEYAGIGGCVPLVMTVSASVFGATFWGLALWDGFFSPMAGCCPWWWGV